MAGLRRHLPERLHDALLAVLDMVDRRRPVAPRVSLGRAPARLRREEPLEFTHFLTVKEHLTPMNKG